MDFKNGQNGFSYNYSASEQEEIKKIRQKYTKNEEDKMEKVRRLDRGVTQKAQSVSLIFGILGALVLGLGMSLIMTNIGASLGVFAIVLGVLLGIVGAVLIAFAYPVHNYITKIEREKIAPEILRLTEELMK